MLNHVFPQILFRKNKFNEDEFNIAKQYFDCNTLRSQFSRIYNYLDKPSTIIGRYSVLPYYKEVEDDLLNFGYTLINSYSTHKYIADFLWYSDVKEYTPKTWFYDLSQCDYDGPFVVKGRTNSKKNQWATKMFAQDKRQALLIASELMSDDNIAQQGIVFREYVPLETLEMGIGGMRFSNEWRLFFYKDELVAHGYYWEIAEEDTIKNAKLSENGMSFGLEMADIISTCANFFVLDIAQKEGTDDWVLIEVNDAQMSGLQCIDAHQFYKNLFAVLSQERILI